MRLIEQAVRKRQLGGHTWLDSKRKFGSLRREIGRGIPLSLAPYSPSVDDHAVSPGKRG